MQIRRLYEERYLNDVYISPFCLNQARRPALQLLKRAVCDDGLGPIRHERLDRKSAQQQQRSKRDDPHAFLGTRPSPRRCRNTSIANACISADEIDAKKADTGKDSRNARETQYRHQQPRKME
jgi:hypothetical protein